MDLAKRLYVKASHKLATVTDQEFEVQLHGVPHIAEHLRHGEQGCSEHHLLPVTCKMTHVDAVDIRDYTVAGKGAFDKAHFLVHVAPQVGALQKTLRMLEDSIQGVKSVEWVREGEGIRVIFDNQAEASYYKEQLCAWEYQDPDNWQDCSMRGKKARKKGKNFQRYTADSLYRKMPGNLTMSVPPNYDVMEAM